MFLIKIKGEFINQRSNFHLGRLSYGAKIMILNMTSIVRYLNNLVIKLTIYFNSHIRIVEQIIMISRFHTRNWFIQT